MALIVAATLLTVAVVVYVISPIIQDRHAPMQSDDGASDALAKKRTALMALRDVEYDLATGKLDQADYESLKAELSLEALAAVKAEEQVLGRGPGALVENATVGPPELDPTDLENAQRTPTSAPASRSGGVAGAEPGPDARLASSEPVSSPEADDLEVKIARLRAGLRDGTTCTVCAHVNRVGSAFCTNCGRPLEREPSVPRP